MKRGTLLLPIVLAIMSRIALAQGAEDPTRQLGACSRLERAERMECLDTLSRAVAPPARSMTEAGWVVSETTSPVDYSPIASATIGSRAVAGGSAMQLSIHCRGGRTEVVIAGSAIAGRAEDYTISYSVSGGQLLQIAATAPAYGAGVAFKTDAIALLSSLPSEADVAVHLSPRVGATRDGIFSLAGLGKVRAKIAAACKWPLAVAKPND